MKWKIGIIATVTFTASCIATAHVSSDHSSDPSRRLLGRAGPEDFDEGRPRVKEQPKVPILDSNGFAAHEDGAPSVDDLTKRTPSYALSPRPQSLDTINQVVLQGSSSDDHVSARMANREYGGLTPENMNRENWRRDAMQELREVNKGIEAATPEERLEMVEMSLETLREAEDTLQGTGQSFFDGWSIKFHKETRFLAQMIKATAPGREAWLKFEEEELSKHYQQNAKARRKRSKSRNLSHHTKRESPLDTIEQEEGGTLSGNQTSSQSAAEFELYLAAFQAARANASEIIMPIIQNMTAGTNSSLVFGAAWSLYSDLTFSSPYVIGPFTHGLDCLTWIEDNIFNITKYNTSDPVQKRRQSQILALDQMLLDKYNEAWTSATAALNKTGLLTNMMTLAEYLSPVDTSVMPPGFATYSSPAYDTSFFTASRNTTKH